MGPAHLSLIQHHAEITLLNAATLGGGNDEDPATSTEKNPPYLLFPGGG